MNRYVVVICMLLSSPLEAEVDIRNCKLLINDYAESLSKNYKIILGENDESEITRISASLYESLELYKPEITACQKGLIGKGRKRYPRSDREFIYGAYSTLHRTQGFIDFLTKENKLYDVRDIEKFKGFLGVMVEKLNKLRHADPIHSA